MAEVTAQLNRLRLAPRKVRSVTNLIKGKDVVKALYQLEFLIKRPAPYLIKLVRSAISNAEHNYNMVKENLYIKELKVNEGVKLMRFKAKGFGRAGKIQKKTSHIELVLAERVPGLKGTGAEVKPRRVERPSQEDKGDSVSTESNIGTGMAKKPVVERELGKKGSTLGNFGKRIFRRKVI